MTVLKLAIGLSLGAACRPLQVFTD